MLAYLLTYVKQTTINILTSFSLEGLGRPASQSKSDSFILKQIHTDRNLRTNNKNLEDDIQKGIRFEALSFVITLGNRHPVVVPV